MTRPCRLPAELTIYTVAELRPQWLEWLARPDDEALAVDAGDVAAVDAAGVQLLLSLHNALAARDGSLTLSNASPVLRSACALLGTSALLDAPTPETAARDH